MVDPSRKITIKAYDDVERVSKGTITLPLHVALAIVETTCQVLDLVLPYNILLGCQWIHSIQAIPFTYHQCLKFPFNGREITIRADLEPFEYWKILEGKHPYHFPINRPTSLPPFDPSESPKNNYAKIWCSWHNFGHLESLLFSIFALRVFCFHVFSLCIWMSSFFLKNQTTYKLVLPFYFKNEGLFHHKKGLCFIS